jgi:hypothetical protein
VSVILFALMNNYLFIFPLAMLFVVGATPSFGASLTNTTANPWPNTTTNTPSTATNKPSGFFDNKDHWFDMSSFLATGHGFVPMVMPITEPAVGYGAGVGLIFIDRPEPKPGEKPALPNLAVIGGALTENGTWGAIGSYSHWWLDDRLQTHFFLGYGAANLRYYGLGADSLYNNHSLGYTLRPAGGTVDARYRLGDSPFLAGLGYSFTDTKVSFSGNVLPPNVNLPSSQTKVAGVTPLLAYDTRDNIFTPTKGIYAETSVALDNQIFGGDTDFQVWDSTSIYYLPLSPKWTLGVKADAGFSFGDAPFYARPSISLRGAPARDYQAEDIAQVEAELRWQLWRRFSLIGFAGTGVAWNDFDKFQSRRTLVTGGTGFRYELARKFGLHMGVDVAFGPDTTAVYIQFGSAWFRP